MRLTQIRRSRGMTQTELARQAGLSKRMIAYYERDDAQPPGAIVVALAQSLRVSADTLLGLKAQRETISLRTARLLKRLQKVEKLPPADQRAVLKYLEALVTNRRRATSALDKRQAA